MNARALAKQLAIPLEARTALTVAAVAVGCFLGASADISLRFAGVGTALVFLPYPILTAALWHSPPRLWWILLLASTAGNFLPHRHGGADASFILMTEGVNYLRALIAAAGLRGFTRPGSVFDSMRGMVVYLAFAVAIAPGVAAVGGAAVVLLHGGRFPFRLVWQEWTLSNALTALTVLPLLMREARPPLLRPRFTGRQAVEAASLVVGLLSAGAAAFMASYDPNIHPGHLYWPLPFLLWAAVRFGPRFTTVALLAVTSLSTWGAMDRRGPFVFQTPVHNLLELQLFLIVVSVPLLLLSSLLRQQQHTALALARAEGERRRLEAQQSVEAALRDADRRKDEFIALLGHELRNPLGSIAVSLEVLRRTSSPSRQAAWAQEAIARQLRHVTRLVDDLLDISRITHGKIRLHVSAVDLRKVTENALEVTRPIIDSSGHRLVVDVPAEPVPVEGDAVRLTQVVANLLNNAAKYSEPGGRIEVRVHRGPGSASLSVRDHGIGIGAEFLERIFEPFMQIPGAREPASPGLGVGLTLVKRVIELHGGRVAAASAGAGRGSEFSISLPLLEDGARADDAAAEVAEPARPGRRVLIADDNVDQAEALRQLLELDDHVVEVVHDGAQALEALSQRDPDVMLVDISLPVVDGLEVARRVRERYGPQRPLLVAVTGLGAPADIRRSTDAGFDHHLVKPIDLSLLEQLLAGSGALSPG